ncbi:hypothetical protein ARALYDRAFT_355089 [Arabidopsis lyrata subsp. lyrata]|uniref:Uncharacterized protein n=1 Tax=Arabidopsis lyrata subsp. lyrata TaxID=81972 RepID=D7M9S2_ARALL|nr:hypothetical protein ARALYDRAFT_355089 [Arabidopsis lyrata subsp. lyrata]
MEVPSDAEVANKEEEEEVRNSEDVDGEVEVTNSKEGDGEAEVSNSIDADEEERHLDDERGERGSADEEVERNIDAEGRERGSDEEKEEGTNAANAKLCARVLESSIVDPLLDDGSFLYIVISFLVTGLTRLRSSVAARTMSSQSSQRVFQLRQDPLTGNSEWIVIEDNDQPGTSTDGLLATTSYLDMLNDSRRNRAYRLAIEKTITETKSYDKKSGMQSKSYYIIKN